MREQPIWRGALLILAGITAIFGVVAGILAARGDIPEPWGTGLLWTFASASLTLTTARIWHTRSVGRRELELILLAGATLLLSSFVFVPPR
jgi:hypothetical protein